MDYFLNYTRETIPAPKIEISQDDNVGEQEISDDDNEHEEIEHVENGEEMKQEDVIYEEDENCEGEEEYEGNNGF